MSHSAIPCLRTFQVFILSSYIIPSSFFFLFSSLNGLTSFVLDLFCGFVILAPSRIIGVAAKRFSLKPFFFSFINFPHFGQFCQMGSTSATRAALHGHCDVVDLLLSEKVLCKKGIRSFSKFKWFSLLGEKVEKVL